MSTVFILKWFLATILLFSTVILTGTAQTTTYPTPTGNFLVPTQRTETLTVMLSHPVCAKFPSKEHP